jgi:hypothetical protein
MILCVSCHAIVHGDKRKGGGKSRNVKFDESGYVEWDV